MKKNLLVLFMSVTISIYGQTNLKTNTEDLQEEKVTYQYYEDETTGDFVKHGTFKYVKYCCPIKLSKGKKDCLDC